MRHVIVRRTVLLLAGVLVALAVLFAWLVSRGRESPSPPGADESGATLFATHCASCHDLEELRRATVPASVERRAQLERFLLRHGTSSDDEDRRILDYLLAEHAPGDGAR